MKSQHPPPSLISILPQLPYILASSIPFFPFRGTPSKFRPLSLSTFSQKLHHYPLSHVPLFHYTKASESTLSFPLLFFPKLKPKSTFLGRFL